MSNIRFSSRSTVTEDEVVDVVMSGDRDEIRKWVTYSLPLAKPLDLKSSNSNSVLNPQVEDVILKVMKQCPPSTRAIFREELSAKGIFVQSGDTNEVHDAVIKTDMLAIRHWVRSIPLDDCHVDQYGRFIKGKESNLPPTFIQNLVKIVDRSTPATKEFLLTELAKRGIFLPEDHATLITSHEGSSSPIDDDESDAGSVMKAPEFDFTRLVVRLGRTGLLFRPRPTSPEHRFMDNIAPIGQFSPLHFFLVNYMSQFNMQTVLEKYCAWYELQYVDHRLFKHKRDEILNPSVYLVRKLFEEGNVEGGLASGLCFRPPNYDVEGESARGVFEVVDPSVWSSAGIEFEYLEPLIKRVDYRDLKPTFQTQFKLIRNLEELRLALQQYNVPSPQYRLGYQVSENLEGAKSDSTLFSYLYQQCKVNVDVFLNKNEYADLIDEEMSAERLRLRDLESKALAVIRDWLRHRSATAAFHAVLTQIKPENNQIWDAISSLTVRVALANYQPVSEPKYDFPPELDEFDSRRRKRRKGSRPHQEIINAAFTFLDMMTFQDTNDVACLSLYLDAIDCFARYRPDIFGARQLAHAIGKAYVAGRQLQQELRKPVKWIRPQPFLIQLKQLPQDLRKVFAALGLVYSKDCDDVDEKRSVLRILTSFFLMYNVQFSENLANTWKKLEGGPTAQFVRWILALSGAFKITPEALVNQLTYSNGLFDNRREVVEHITLLVGARSGWTPAYRSITGAGSNIETAWDRTSLLLNKVPSLFELPARGVKESDWLSYNVLRHALNSITEDAEFDSSLPMLALDLGARREDCFITCLLTHEAAYYREENQLRDLDQALTVPGRDKPRFRMRDMEEVILRLVSRHRYLILIHAFQVFYPKCVLLDVCKALLFYSRGRYRDSKALFLKFIPILTANKGFPDGYHLTGKYVWTMEMLEEMLRSAFGVHSEFPQPSAYDTHWMKELLQSLNYQAGVVVLEELSPFYSPSTRVGKYDFVTSEKLFEEKMHEFKEMVADGASLWEYSWEREAFYFETETEFREKGANPVVMGAFYYSVWCHFKYMERRNPRDPVDPKEEVQLLYMAVFHWTKCDPKVYSEVVFSMKARLYCLMVANELDGMEVRLSESEKIKIHTQSYFPPSSTPPLPTDPTQAMVEAAAAAINAAPPKKYDFGMKDYTKEEEDAELEENQKKNGDEEEDGEGEEAPIDFEAEIAKEMKKQEDATKQFESDVENGCVAERMDRCGFFVYRPLRPHKYMPVAARWEQKWEEESLLEKQARDRGLDEDEIKAELEQRKAEMEGYGEAHDDREMDVNLFIEVIDRLLYSGRYQQAYFLANDIITLYPHMFKKLLPELDDHMQRLRLVFYFAGIDKMAFSDLGMDNPAPQGPGRKRVKPDLGKAPQFANIKWLPTAVGNDFVLVNRQRLAWNSETKINPMRALLITQFPEVNDVAVRQFLEEDRKRKTVDGRISVLGELKKHDRDLTRVCDLFITALLIHHHERQKSIAAAEAKGKQAPQASAGEAKSGVAKVVAALVEAANDGKLPLLMSISKALNNCSVLDVVKMKPTQIVYELLQNARDLVLIKQYLRVAAEKDSKEPVDFLVGAFQDLIERQCEADATEVSQKRFDAEKAILHLSGQEWRDAKARIDSEAEFLATKKLEQGWSRNRFISYAGCAGERRLMFDLGHSFLSASRRIDIHSHVAARGANTVEAMERLKFELMYAAYFSFFAASHIEGLKDALHEIDSTLFSMKDREDRFKMFSQRTLFLTGEYKSFPMSIPVAVGTQKSAGTRAKIREEAKRKLDAATSELKQHAAVLEESESAMDSDDYGDSQERHQRRKARDRLRIANEHASALDAAARDDQEVELANKRQKLVIALLERLQGNHGYELFLELESIAASFKDLAWDYQESKQYKQSLDCHRIAELIMTEMEYVPVKLRRFNWVDPDEYEFNTMWKFYSTYVPAKVREERAQNEEERRDEDDDLDPTANPNLLSVEQLELFVSDCVLSGVDGRYLDRVRKEFAKQAQIFMREGKAPGRTFKELHSIIGRTIQLNAEQTNEMPVTKEELKKLIVAEGEEMMDFDPTHKHTVGVSNGEEPDHPSTVVFIVKDKYGKWNLGVDATNANAAQQALRVLNSLHKFEQAQLFRDYYYSKE